MRILIVHEDRALMQELPPRLRGEGHLVSVRPSAGDPSALADSILAAGVHLLVFEPALLPFGRALDLCRALRRESAVLLLLVSHVTGVAERVRALETGADDYLLMPFDPDELLARVHVLLRRHPLNLVAEGVGLVRITDGLSLDLPGQRLVGDGREVALTDREFRLLAHLVRHEGVVLTREALLQAAWALSYDGSTREVDVYMRYLRQKLEPGPAKPRYLLTVWGRGYQFKRSHPSAEQRSLPGFDESASESAA